jgi:hypothetical protein
MNASNLPRRRWLLRTARQTISHRLDPVCSHKFSSHKIVWYQRRIIHNSQMFLGVKRNKCSDWPQSVTANSRSHSSCKSTGMSLPRTRTQVHCNWDLVRGTFHSNLIVFKRAPALDLSSNQQSTVVQTSHSNGCGDASCGTAMSKNW